MTLHERIAEALGWTLAEAQSMSLPTLREIVRPVSPKLAHEISEVLHSGSHIVGEPLKKKRRRVARS